MAKKAIIKINTLQYVVEEGKEYIVPKFDAEEGQAFSVPEVLAVADGEKYLIGKPTVDTKVVLDIVEQGKGEKVVQRIYRAKSRYSRTRGHRKLVTKFKVNSIG